MSSNRLAIGQSLVSFLQGIQNPGTGQSLYRLVKLGAIFDPSAYTTGGAVCAEVVFNVGKSGPAGSGGNLIGWRIEDNPVFQITSMVDYEADSTAAMVSMLGVMDTLLPTIHSHYQLPSANNPLIPVSSLYSVLEADQNDHGQPIRFPNGHIYYLWSTFVVCKQQYNVQITNP